MITGVKITIVFIVRINLTFHYTLRVVLRKLSKYVMFNLITFLSTDMKDIFYRILYLQRILIKSLKRSIIRIRY